MAPVRLDGRLRRPSLRRLVLPRDRGAPPGRRGGPRPRARHAPRHPARAADPRGVCVPHPVPLERHRPGRGRPRHERGAALRQLPHDLRRGHRHAAAGRDRRGRARGELPLDRLRLRAPALLALARGLLPALAVGDAPDPRDAAPGAHRRRRGGLRGRPRRLVAGLGPPRRGRAAQHGRVRSRDLVRAADVVLRAAPHPPAEHPAPIPQPVRHLRCRGRRVDRARDPGRPLRGRRRLPQRRDRRGRLVRGRARLLRRPRATPPGVLAEEAFAREALARERESASD